MACLEREYRQLWQSIHRGWEWIRNDLRSRLRQKWLRVYVNHGCGRDSESVWSRKQDSTHIPPTSGEQRERERERRITTHEADLSYRAYHTCEESAEYVRAIRSEAEALRGSLKASETLRKALRKLTSLDWVLCYERYCADTDIYSCPVLSIPIRTTPLKISSPCRSRHHNILITVSCVFIFVSIKAELSLQAEALALDLKVLWDTLSQSRGDSVRPPSSSSSSSSSSSLFACTAWTSTSEQEQEHPVPMRSILSCQTFLSKLNRACVVFISWANELEEYSVSLNAEIAKDKDIYRDTIGLR
jgi:hypothetical protein